MHQIAWNLTYADGGIVSGKGYLIHDRDPLFTTEFVKVFADVGITVKLPPRSPNLNAYAERFVRSIKESCLERLSLLARSRCGQLLEASWLITTASAITSVWPTD
jgi:hypothetical protein